MSAAGRPRFLSVDWLKRNHGLSTRDRRLISQGLQKTGCPDWPGGKLTEDAFFEAYIACVGSIGFVSRVEMLIQEYSSAGKTRKKQLLTHVRDNVLDKTELGDALRAIESPDDQIQYVREQLLLRQEFDILAELLWIELQFSLEVAHALEIIDKENELRLRLGDFPDEVRDHHGGDEASVPSPPAPHAVVEVDGYSRTQDSAADRWTAVLATLHSILEKPDAAIPNVDTVVEQGESFGQLETIVSDFEAEQADRDLGARVKLLAASLDEHAASIPGDFDIAAPYLTALDRLRIPLPKTTHGAADKMDIVVDLADAAMAKVRQALDYKASIAVAYETYYRSGKAEARDALDQAISRHDDMERLFTEAAADMASAAETLGVAPSEWSGDVAGEEAAAPVPETGAPDWQRVSVPEPRLEPVEGEQVTAPRPGEGLEPSSPFEQEVRRGICCLLRREEFGLAYHLARSGESLIGSPTGFIPAVVLRLYAVGRCVRGQGGPSALEVREIVSKALSLAEHLDPSGNEMDRATTLISPLKKASLTGFHRTAKHKAAKVVSRSSETMRTI